MCGVNGARTSNTWNDVFVHIAQKRDGSVAFPPQETRIHGAGKRVLANFEVSNFFLN